MPSTSALAIDPQNPFTLNNLGVAYESVSDLDNALRYYREAAATRSKEPAMITLDSSWRGRSVSAIAQESARRLQRRLQSSDTPETKAVMYTLRGVHAENANNWTEARQDFLQAYALDPSSAFSLNNRGYVAEREGDLETAQFFYQRAQRAANSTTKVGVATRLYARDSPSSPSPITAMARSTTHSKSTAANASSLPRPSSSPPAVAPRRNPPTLRRITGLSNK